jgi:hypothetical protein
MTVGSGAHLAPLGFLGRVMGKPILLGTVMVNEICSPSGDQRMLPGPSVRRVICVDSRVSTHMTWIWDPFGSPAAV